MVQFCAHAANDEGNWHGLVEHLNAVAEMAGRFCNPSAAMTLATTRACGMMLASSILNSSGT